MPHIELAEGLPGIRALFAFRQDTAKILCDLANALLYESNTLSQAERELIGTYVSSENDCHYWQTAHGAIAAAHLGGNAKLVAGVKSNFERAEISEKLKALLAIACEVQQGGKHVQPATVDRARRAGASDAEIHDAVLIAAAFCTYNRYVDGLATWAPADPEAFKERAACVARNGYSHVPQEAAAGSQWGPPRRNRRVPWRIQSSTILSMPSGTLHRCLVPGLLAYR
jgi:uncharacterized peroxidase-related enzyme